MSGFNDHLAGRLVVQLAPEWNLMLGVGYLPVFSLGRMHGV
jgi:hypothetical protein